MCIPAIIDASAFGSMLDPLESMEFLSWIERGDGVLVYSNTGGYWEELCKSPGMLSLIDDYRDKNRVHLVAASSLHAAEASLTHAITRSGAKDKPVLALAKASGALVLCSDDNRLKQDFLDTRLLPAVGRRKRSVYPFERPKTVRRGFLGRRRCSARRQP